MKKRKSPARVKRSAPRRSVKTAKPKPKPAKTKAPAKGKAKTPQVKSKRAPKAKRIKTSAKKTVPKKESFPHFRRYRKSGHPALIVGEESTASPKKEEYKYRKVMHSERDGKHINEKVNPNPNPKDSEPMYIAKRVRQDEKKNFEERLPWKYPKKDKKK